MTQKDFYDYLVSQEVVIDQLLVKDNYSDVALCEAYGHISSHKNKITSEQQHDTSTRPFANPAYWAAFACYGLG